MKKPSNRGAEERRSRGEGENEIDLPSRFSLLLCSSAPLLLCFVLALLVRAIGLTWGLPDAARWYSYHPDESDHQIVGAVALLLRGDFNPHFFNYPSLSIYATWAFYQLLAGFGLLTNAVSPDYPWPVARDILVAGRLFSVVCGALTAPLIFLIARRLGMKRAAILAGILVALAPGLVQHSHFATVDVPASFFVVLCLYLSLRAENWRGLAWAALVAGLAAGTKYNAGLVLVAPLVSLHFLWNRDVSPRLGKRVLGNLSLIFIALASFFVTTPYALLAPREFWGDGLRGGENGFAYELLVHPKIGSGDIFQGTGNGWIYHFTFNLPFVLTWPVILAALIGIVFAAKKREFWPILAFSALFFLSLGFSQVRYMRYLLPLAPPLCLLAAYGISRLKFPRVCGAVVAAFALVGCFNVVWPFTQTDPRDLAARPMRDGLARGDKMALANNPWYFTPPFQPRGNQTLVSNVAVTGLDSARLQLEKPRYFAISEFEFREAVRLHPDGSQAQFLKLLKSRAKKQWSYKTQIPLALPGRDFVPHDYLYPNPETQVYELN